MNSNGFPPKLQHYNFPNVPIAMNTNGIPQQHNQTRHQLHTIDEDVEVTSHTFHGQEVTWDGPFKRPVNQKKGRHEKVSKGHQEMTSLQGNQSSAPHRPLTHFPNTPNLFIPHQHVVPGYHQHPMNFNPLQHPVMQYGQGVQVASHTSSSTAHQQLTNYERLQHKWQYWPTLQGSDQPPASSVPIQNPLILEDPVIESQFLSNKLLENISHSIETPTASDVHMSFNQFCQESQFKNEISKAQKEIADLDVILKKTTEKRKHYDQLVEENEEKEAKRFKANLRAIGEQRDEDFEKVRLEAIEEKKVIKEMLETGRELREGLSTIASLKRILEANLNDPIYEEAPFKRSRPERMPSLMEELESCDMTMDDSEYFKDIPGLSEALAGKAQNLEEAQQKAQCFNHRIGSLDLSPWLFTKHRGQDQFPQLVIKVTNGQQIYEAINQHNNTTTWSQQSNNQKRTWNARAGTLQVYQKKEEEQGMIVLVPEKEMERGKELDEQMDFMKEFFY